MKKNHFFNSLPEIFFVHNLFDEMTAWYFEADGTRPARLHRWRCVQHIAVVYFGVTRAIDSEYQMHVTIYLIFSLSRYLVLTRDVSYNSLERRKTKAAEYTENTVRWFYIVRGIKSQELRTVSLSENRTNWKVIRCTCQRMWKNECPPVYTAFFSSFVWNIRFSSSMKNAWG